MSRLPDFIIIGAMKCATSTLHEQLAKQPGFWMSEPKEIYFFSDDPVYANGLEWYSEHFKGAAESDLCGESSTHYTKLPTYPDCLARMREHVPEAKLIYVMRHPIDRLVSQYIHQWSEKQISLPISEAIRQHEELIAYSQYHRQLKPFIDTYGKDMILPVFFDYMRTESQAQLEAVCDFLGYQGKPQWDFEMGQQNVSNQRMRKSTVRDLLVNAPLLSQLRRYLIPPSVRNQIKTLWQMKKRPELSQADKAYLQSVFDEDLNQLGQLLGIEDLNCENYKTLSCKQLYHWV